MPSFTSRWVAPFSFFQSSVSSTCTVRVVQLWVNSGTTGVMGLGWNIGFSLCAAPLLSFLFHISKMSEEDQERDKRDDEELLKSIFKLMYSGVSKSLYMEVKAD